MAGSTDMPVNIRDPHRTAMQVIAGIVVFRLLYLVPFVATFDLVGDESYYWDWGRNLDWGYFSKPPMIGWLMGLVGRLSGNSEWGIRLGALALGTASLVLIHRLAKNLFGPRTALVALLLASLTPANAALNLFLTIDAPLVLCWTAALLVFWSLTENPDNLPRWILLTVILGLGHLSKQMMLVFPLLMIFHAALNPTARPLLRRGTFWISIFASLLFLAPMVWWNAQHNWVTLKHTSHHFETRPDSNFLDHLGTFGAFLGLQALTFSPVTWLLMIACVFGGLWKWRVLDVRERYLVLFSGPALAVFALLSLRQDVNPNWPAVFYLSAIVLAGGWLDHATLDPLPWRRLRGWMRAALLAGAISAAAAYVLPFAIGLLGLGGNVKFDPAERLRGWRVAGTQAGALLAKVPNPAQTFVIVLGARDNASQLAFHMPQQPRVFRFGHSDVIESQYELWPDPGDLGFMRGDALVFIPPDEKWPQPPEIPGPLDRQFRAVKEFGEVRVPMGNGSGRYYRVCLMECLKFWDPPPSTRVETTTVPESPPK